MLTGQDIELFRTKHSMSQSAFGKGCVNDHLLINRMQGGKSITTRTIDRIYKYMETYKSSNKG